MSDLIPDNDKILSDDLTVAIGEYLRVCGGDLKHNNFHLLHEAKTEIERLTTENGRLGTIIDKALDEGYLSNEWLQRELDSAPSKQD